MRTRPRVTSATAAATKACMLFLSAAPRRCGTSRRSPAQGTGSARIDLPELRADPDACGEPELSGGEGQFREPADSLRRCPPRGIHSPVDASPSQSRRAASGRRQSARNDALQSAASPRAPPDRDALELPGSPVQRDETSCGAGVYDPASGAPRRRRHFRIALSSAAAARGRGQKGPVLEHDHTGRSALARGNSAVHVRTKANSASRAAPTT